MKIGPFLIANSPSLGLYIDVPRRSAGRRSGVNWMRVKSIFSSLEIVFIVKVFASPGSPSKRTWPLDKSAIVSCSTTSS